jgi:hypothetical protein
MESQLADTAVETAADFRESNRAARLLADDACTAHMRAMALDAAPTEMPCRSSLPFAYNRNGRESNNHDKALDGAVLALHLQLQASHPCMVVSPFNFLPKKQTEVSDGRC